MSRWFRRIVILVGLVLVVAAIERRGITESVRRRMM